MATLPVLETSRLRLRPRTLGDLEDCIRMDREPGTLDWIAWPEPTGGWDDEPAHRALIRERTLAKYPAGQGYWVVVEKARPEAFLGWVMLIPENATGPEVEIGWRFLEAARGRGCATEAAQTLLAYGLGSLALPGLSPTFGPRTWPPCGSPRRSACAPRDAPLARST